MFFQTYHQRIAECRNRPPNGITVVGQHSCWIRALARIPITAERYLAHHHRGQEAHAKGDSEEQLLNAVK
jgi:hypothetical protein